METNKYEQLQMPLPRSGRLRNPCSRMSHQHRLTELLQRHDIMKGWNGVLCQQDKQIQTKRSTFKNTAKSKADWAIRYKYTELRTTASRSANKSITDTPDTVYQ